MISIFLQAADCPNTWRAEPRKKKHSLHF